MPFIILFFTVLSFCSSCTLQDKDPITPQSLDSFLDVAFPDEVAQELGLDPHAPSDLGSPRGPKTSPGPGSSLRPQPEELIRHFPLVLIINKAPEGPLAQTMTVYHQGQLKFQFTVSTGRERYELAKSGRRYFSETPTGWFSPTQTFESYYSKTWLAWMNYSVFFTGGIAIHATTSNYYKDLGKRASGGCIRLREEQAKMVYELILREGRGLVPKFTRDGRVFTDASGRIKRHQSWNTLIVVEDDEKEPT